MTDAAPELTGVRRRWSRGGSLRLRVVVAFSVGSLVISATIAIATYAICERYLVEQRENALLRQAWSDARIMEQSLAADDRPAAISSYETAPGSKALVNVDGAWFGTSVGIGRSDIPRSLRTAVAAGAPAHQRIRLDGTPFFVVGVPLPSENATFYEFTSIAPLDRTLRTISAALVAGGAVASLLGALLALWIARLVVRPLTETARAAERVAAGDLDTRLDKYDDPDLALLSDSFNQMVDAVQHRLRREASFSSDVSHELRSPITTLAAATELMRRRRDQLPPDMQEIFDLLCADIARFSQLVEDLLEISRADAGAEELRLEPVVLEEFIRHYTDRLDEHITIEVAADIVGSRILLDKRRFERVIENLTANARAYADGVTAIRISRRDSMARIELEDAGPGIAPEERALIFERFHRGSSAGRRGSTKGSGLGLALVAEQVRLHGGKVEVLDALTGDGARFVVELPWRSV
ncbi:MAG: HAMP domain-containing histidine kinase [Acidimicrobiia bacterium]|nr:HAMP domain-containing histidine kinase [Acidimicrobiia bacterium]